MARTLSFHTWRADPGQGPPPGQEFGAVHEVVGRARTPEGFVDPQGVDVQAAGVSRGHADLQHVQAFAGHQLAQHIRDAVHFPGIGQKQAGQASVLFQEEGVS